MNLKGIKDILTMRYERVINSRTLKEINFLSNRNVNIHLMIGFYEANK